MESYMQVAMGIVFGLWAWSLGAHFANPDRESVVPVLKHGGLAFASILGLIFVDSALGWIVG